MVVTVVVVDEWQDLVVCGLDKLLLRDEDEDEEEEEDDDDVDADVDVDEKILLK